MYAKSPGAATPGLFYTVLSGWFIYQEHPYLTQDEQDGDVGAVQYIANMRDGAVAGYKYFLLKDAYRITLEVRGTGQGSFLVSTDKEEKTDWQGYVIYLKAFLYSEGVTSICLRNAFTK